MTPPVFYVGHLPPDADRLVLDGAEGQHAVRVRRIRVGETLRIADGFGSYAEGVVDSVGQRDLTMRVLERGSEPRPQPGLTVVQALPKGDRATLAVEMLTEIGVDRIVPWQSARCVSRWDGSTKAVRGAERWRSVAREAAKQSRRSRIPVVDELADTMAVHELVRSAERAVVLHEDAGTGLDSLAVPSTGEVVVVVGPEGGLSADEVRALESAGGVAVRLGREVLRTSTAGVSALAVISARSGRWSPPGH